MRLFRDLFSLGRSNQACRCQLGKVLQLSVCPTAAGRVPCGRVGKSAKVSAPGVRRAGLVGFADE